MNISSTSSSTGSSDYSRITGLASGLDTDGLVTQMLSGEQSKIDKAMQTQQTLEWQQESYVTVIDDLKDFSSTYLDIVASSTTNMRTSSTYVGLAAESTNETSISATAGSTAVKGNYSVTVVQKATTARMQSTALAGATQSTVLNTLNGEDLLPLADGNIDITINGESFSIAMDATKTISDLVTSIKTATNAGGKTLGDLVNVSFSELTGKLTVESKDVGVAQSLTISGTAATQLGIDTVAKTGTNATVQIKAPGETAAVTVGKTSNKFTIDGVSYDITDATNADTATITVKSDAASSIAKIKTFVEAYNTMIEKLNTLVSEKKNYDYPPLTDAQKEEMTEDQIAEWEQKAKLGILRNDGTLNNMLTSMREAIYDTVEGAGISITEIGITTSKNYSDKGKLIIDEEKLATALETNGDAIYKLFNQSSADVDQKGILSRFDDIFDAAVGSEGTLIQKAGYENTRWTINNQLSKRITEMEERISRLNEIFEEKKDRYYSLFATLETNMSNLNSQSNWLYSSLGSA